MEFKIFHIRKDNTPPYNTTREEVLLMDGLIVTLEHHFYELEFHYYELPLDTSISIDGTEVDPSLISNDIQKGIITVGLSQHFSNQLGLVKVSCGKESFQVRVDASKLSSEDAEGMITYLYKKNKSIILKLFTKDEEESIDQKNKSNLLSTTRLQPLENFLQNMENLLPELSHSPRSSTIQAREIQDFASANIDNASIDWLIEHLDELYFDDALKDHPDAIEINGMYTVIDHIDAPVVKMEYATYENECILGGFYWARKLIDDLLSHLEYINHQKQITQNDGNGYATFESAQVIINAQAVEDVTELKTRLFRVERKYRQLLPNTQPNFHPPKLTKRFSSVNVYSKIFLSLQQVYNLKIDTNGESGSLKTSFLDQIYELFTYYRLKDALEDCFRDYNVRIEEEDLQEGEFIPKRISIQPNQGKWMLNFLYQPQIGREPKDTHLVLHGKPHRDSFYYTPDFVVEYMDPKLSLRYAILDAKYKMAKTVLEQDLKESSFKYYTCVRVIGEKRDHQKPDFLWLICPNACYGKPVWTMNYDENFLPIIGIVMNNAENNDPIKQSIKKMIKEWKVGI
ncbi:hypothetical protein KMW28_06860 [Flammeovirga yaeyamensis]|uniref:DUF2357 domain-containing protein n=1 Tax=Flammeovirga yaeyamensis TaxID=367791 RepID=A0AAX1N6W6_9BACT|nr:hypothetical protein [Flammeovirga yaeyamensis]MBB3697895.1 hypothetical protein [Flammeovirga yaeyamensis]NMF35750.1 hypothetical protein [Flammeovirga yaeyamensis]QWG03298.1 hypothetical protein KMW28_06860 [Flammeovirga yaeyamensis]